MNRPTTPEPRPIKGSAGRRPHVANRHMAVGPKLAKNDVLKSAARAKDSIAKLLEEGTGETMEESMAENFDRDAKEYWERFEKENKVALNPDGSRRGFISPDSIVADTAHVGAFAKVMGGAHILGEASVEDKAIVFGATLKDNSAVRNNAFVGPDTILSGKSWVIEDASVVKARLFDDTEVSGSAHVDGGDETVELHDRVIVSGHARVFGRNVLRGRMNVTGRYELVDGGEITSDDLFVK